MINSNTSTTYNKISIASLLTLNDIIWGRYTYTPLIKPINLNLGSEFQPQYIFERKIYNYDKNFFNSHIFNWRLFTCISFTTFFTYFLDEITEELDPCVLLEIYILEYLLNESIEDIAAENTKYFPELEEILNNKEDQPKDKKSQMIEDYRTLNFDYSKIGEIKPLYFTREWIQWNNYMLFSEGFSGRLRALHLEIK